MSIAWKGPRYCSRFVPRSTLHCHCRTLNNGRGLLKVSEEVQQAVAERQPVVALETTIYTHGLPYPDNLSLASHLESLIRQHGGVPATIGILDGVARVGFRAQELERLIESAKSSETLKVSRRDLGFALGLKDSAGKPMNGGTTVAGTMILAHLAGVRIFATGGLGGVHRGAETSMDVSADLTELGRTPVAVISSGCKAFLDIPKTLEYLETQGVAVATFSDGQDELVDFPAFWTRESGIPSPKTFRNESEAAAVIHAHMQMGLQSGLHFANPIPQQHSLPRELMEASIFEALKHAKSAGAIGAAATPYILSKIKSITGDKSVAANKALIEANVVRAVKVAKELSKLEALDAPEASAVNDPEGQVVGPGAVNYMFNGVSKGVTPPSAPHKMFNQSPQDKSSSTAKPFREQTSTLTDAHSSVTQTTSNDEPRPNVFVAGSLAIDLACDYAMWPESGTTDGNTMKPAVHTSNPAQITQSLGGVASNVASAAHLLGASVHLCSAVGNDLAGKTAVEALSAMNLSTVGVKSLSDGDSRTAQYVAVNDAHRDLYMAMADMSILESTSSGTNSLEEVLQSHWLPQLRNAKPSHLVLDANWPSGRLGQWLQAGKDISAHVAFEPVSVAKSARLFKLEKPYELAIFRHSLVHLATPNASELTAMHTAARESHAFGRSDWWEVIDAFGIPSSGARVQLALATSNELVDQGIPQQSIQLLPFIPSICTKLGADGVLLTQIIPAHDARLTSGEYAPYILSRCANGTEDSLGVGGVYMRLFPAIETVKQEDVVSVNGVGDTFAGALVAGLASKPGSHVEDFIDLAQRAAVLTLKSTESVSPGLGTLRLLL